MRASQNSLSSIAPLLLAWYDDYARDLPWRHLPGVIAEPDPYRIWLSEVMLQQTTVAAVKGYFHDFIDRWPTVEALAAADPSDVMAAWAGLGYYARARNLHACARQVVSRFGGVFPSEEEALRQLPGIGDYTAAAIAAIAFGKYAVVVDANVARVVTRLAAIEEPLPKAKHAIRAAAHAMTPLDRAGDFAQAMMDLGATICLPHAPDCAQCPLSELCVGRASGIAAQLPYKPPKQEKPRKSGWSWWIEKDACVWLIRRPDKGLLGGMRALPGSEWSDDRPPLPSWARPSSIQVRHAFTHFTLTLDIADGDYDGTLWDDGEWWPIHRLEEAGLPTLYRKAVSAKMGKRGK